MVLDPLRNDRHSVLITVFGTRWCAATQFVRRYLDRLNVPYTYRDMDHDPEAAGQVRWWTGGYLSHPTVQVGGDILVEPTSAELQSCLARNKLI